jgi:HEAT repeat protein
LSQQSDVSKEKFTDIKYLLRDLLKVIKIVSIYPESNPLPQSLKQSFAERLVELIDDFSTLTLTVEQDRLVFEQATAFEDRSKEESLASIFFESGITELRFSAGIDVDSVYRLLEAIRVYQNSVHDQADLIALLWEAEISGFAFETLEEVILGEYDETFELSKARDEGRGDAGEQSYEELFSARETHVSEERPADDTGGLHYAELDDNGSLIEDSDGSLHIQEAAEAMGLTENAKQSKAPIDTAVILDGEFNADQQDSEYLAALLNEDDQFNPYQSTVDLLHEMLYQEPQMSEFYKTVSICEKIQSELVSHGRLGEALQLLQLFCSLDTKIREKRPLWAERLRDAFITAGSRERLAIVSDMLNSDSSVDSQPIIAYLNNFTWESLSGMAELLGVLEHREHRLALVELLKERGKEKVELVAQGVFDPRWYVVRNSVSILASIADDRAISYIRKALTHDERRVRAEAANALAACPNETALDLLATLAHDPDAEIRRTAIQSISTRRGPAAFNAIADVINDGDFDSLLAEEKRRLLVALSIVGGDQALDYLFELASKWNVGNNQSIADSRSAAFEAMSKNKSERCRQMLVSLSKKLRPEIKRLAQQALLRQAQSTAGNRGNA